MEREKKFHMGCKFNVGFENVLINLKTCEYMELPTWTEASYHKTDFRRGAEDCKINGCEKLGSIQTSLYPRGT